MRERLFGIDLARFIAIAGMMAAHLLVPQFPDLPGAFLTSGFPSALFAVLGGFGVTFAAKRYLSRDERGAALIAGLTRGGLVIGFGLVLGLLPDHPIGIVLVPFGAALAVAAVFVFAPTWVLLLAVALLTIGTPPLLAVFEAVEFGDPALFQAFTVVGAPLFGGLYPVLTWTNYLLIGMILCRTLTQSQLPRVGAAAIIGSVGASVAALSWAGGEWATRTWLAPKFATSHAIDLATALEVLHAPVFGRPQMGGLASLFVLSTHSGSAVDVLRTAGVASALIGLALLLTSFWKTVPLLARPFVGAGSAPLTSYVLHVAMTAFTLVFSAPYGVWWEPGVPWWLHYSFYWQLAVVLIVGTLVSVSGRKGPLEAAVSRVATSAGSAMMETPAPRPPQ